MVLRSLKNNVKHLLCAAVLLWLQKGGRNKIPTFVKSTAKRKHRTDNAIATASVLEHILSVAVNVSQAVKLNEERKEKKNTVQDEIMEATVFGCQIVYIFSSFHSLANVSCDTLYLVVLKVC